MDDRIINYLEKKFYCQDLKVSGVRIESCLVRRGLINAGVIENINKPCAGLKCAQGDIIEKELYDLLANYGMSFEDFIKEIETAIYNEKRRILEQKQGKRKMGIEKNERLECAAPGCGKKLRADSKGGYCSQHQSKAAPNPTREKRAYRKRNGNKAQKRNVRAADNNGDWKGFLNRVQNLSKAIKEFEEAAEKLGEVIPIAEIPKYIESRLT